MPTPPRPARIGFLLSQLGAHAAEVFAAQIRPLGLTASEAGVVRIIGRTPGLTQRQLAERLGAQQSRVVALIDGLERKGLATRTRSTADRRAQQLGLTAAGRAMLAELRSAAEAQEAVIAGSLGEQERADLYALLSTLSGRLGLDADVHPGHGRSADEPTGATRPTA
ncbi:MarR family transcriptional regulator [Galbitalea sp. SE-J8]|uniref:MarR family winged helix-turn-helix transcriptional regulator n=1 Tax=Galbitalea sp. SE-J8 TaxID=3054952 RepID=UPI00259C9CF8|nr:MarR family transcriptional regulator [Galbitalea sp. SE-J8]MDM4763646.1 MarR family transcriptional regulator [Galbitalea sp. SE-J8]